MPGMIDLNSVIAMMNQSAARTQQEADSGFTIGDINPKPSAPLQNIQTPTSGKKKLDDAESPIAGAPKKLASNMLPVDPQQQVLAMMNLDAGQQNYAMQVFDVVNSRNS